MNIKAQLRDLGIELPPPPKPAANYDPSVGFDRLLVISGQLPLLPDGSLLAAGKVGDEVDLELARQCARQCVINALAGIDHFFGGSLKNGFDRVLRVGVFVASTPSFTDQHLVADAASELLHQVFQGRGRHARAAVGCSSLPKNAPVEVEVMIGLTASEHESD